MDESLLLDELHKLLSLQQEGEYWDYKLEWHNSKTNLLHDIICMANNLANHDAYIFIGINNNYEIIGVSQNDPNRKNTQNIVCTLRGAKFVGGMRPIVYVKTIFPKPNTEIDVIVIKNSRNTPYVLSEYCNDGITTIRQGCIYTRNMDGNTPINATADNDQAEKLWRKRFHMDDTAIEKLNHYLEKPESWEKDSRRDVYYYKYAPEYTFEFEYNPDDHFIDNDFLCKMYTDNTATYSPINFKVYNCSIITEYYTGMDGSRFPTIKPNRDYISNGKKGSKEKWLTMTYVVEGTVLFGIYSFLQKDRGYISNLQREKWLEHVIVFKDNEEKEAFKKYIKDNYTHIAQAINTIESNIPISNNDNNRYEWTKEDEAKWKQTKALADIYKKWVSSLHII